MDRQSSRVARVGLCFTAGLFLLPSTAEAELPRKQASTSYGPETRANVAANVAKYDWAREQVDAAVAEAQPWVDTPDEELWRMIVPPKLKRAIMVNVKKGCPNCGMGIYGDAGPRPYAWIGWVDGHPWKVQCPNCKELFPKNDFGAFYESGIDPETGLFDPARGDRSLLFNADHPDPDDPKHKYCVDDGEGWPRFGDNLPERDFYVAYHAYSGRARRQSMAIRALATAYALTGKPIYAHKCAILLDRLADVYPNYDGKNGQLFNNVWGRYSAGILGPNYWAGAGWAQRAIDYDMIFDGIGRMPETLAFIRAKSEQYKVPRPKESIEDIRASIEQRILIEMGKHYDRIHMNGTITEMCMAKVDLVLRGRAALSDLIEKHMPAICPPEHLNPDGSGNEQSTGYDSGAFGQYCSLIQEIAAMDREIAKGVLAGFPPLQAAFDFWAEIWCLEKFVPLIGDVGAPGDQSGPKGTPGAYLTLFDLTGNPRYAQVATRMVGQETAKLPRDIYAPDPEGLIRRAIEADKEAGPWETPSVVKPDYGLSILRSGSGDGRHALWLHYSPQPGTSSHSHFDALNFGLYAFGLSLVCEHGYPLFTGGWPARWGWTSHSRSHALVNVDGQCQKHCGGKKLLAFARAGNVRMISAEAPCVFDNVSMYRRTMMSVEIAPDRTFILDVFRVRGGREHTYTVPFFYGAMSSDGLAMSSHPDMYDGYVTNVQAAPAARPWWVKAAVRSAWKGEVAAHLRVHSGSSDATVLTAQGESRWGRDDPRWLPYLFVRRAGDTSDLNSTFVHVYEPYRDKPFLEEYPLSLEPTDNHINVTVRVAEPEASYTFDITDGGDNVGAQVERTGSEPTRTFELKGIAKNHRLE